MERQSSSGNALPLCRVIDTTNRLQPMCDQIFDPLPRQHRKGHQSVAGGGSGKTNAPACVPGSTPKTEAEAAICPASFDRHPSGTARRQIPIQLFCSPS
jgi:hypothetical protein